MKVDPRFSLSMGEAEGQKALRFSAAGDCRLGESATPLFEAPFSELCELAGVGEAARGRFADAGARTIFLGRA
jgi:hypothetical protein